MAESHLTHVQDLLTEAAAAHRELIAAAPAAIGASLPVDAQGITLAIDHLAGALGFSIQDRRRLVQPHATNPAVLHARVFGPAPLTTDTVIGAFVEGARVRATALIDLADAVGDQTLIEQVRSLLVEYPLPIPEEHSSTQDPTEALKDAYSAQERAALMIAASLDDL